MSGFVNSMKGYVSQGFTYNIYTDYDTFGQVWDARGFDAIIGPGLASPALIHK